MTQTGNASGSAAYDPSYYEDASVNSGPSPRPPVDEAITSRLNDAETSASEVQALVAYYRLPRSESAIHRLSADYPLSDTYTTPVYNTCIQQLLRIRKPGQSIAQIVEIYNEMLQRDCRPSRKTYFLLVEAFANREIDVSRAVEKWQLTKSRAQWWSATLGQAFDEENAAQQDLAIEGYKAEGNLANAFKIVRALQLMIPDGDRSGSARYGRYFLMSQDVDRLLLTACEVGQITIGDLKIVKELYMDRTREGDVVYYRASKMFTILAKLQDAGGLRDLWQMFAKDDEATWQKNDESSRPNDYIRFQRFPAYCTAAKAFIDVGEIDQGVAIFKTLLEKIQAGEMGNVATYSGAVLAPLKALIQVGRLEEFKYLHELFVEAASSQDRGEKKGPPIFVTSYMAMSDELIDRGEWKMAYDLLRPFMGDPRAMAKVEEEEALTSSTRVQAEEPEVSTSGWTGLKNKKEARAVQRREKKINDKEHFINELHRLRLYGAVLKAAANMVESDAESIPAVLALLPPLARSPRRFAHDDTLLKVYLEVVEKIGRYDLIPNVIMDFELPDSSRDPVFVENLLETISRVLEAENLDLTTTMRIIYLMRRYVPTPTDQTTARTLADKYLDARRKVSGPFDLDMKRPLFLELASDLLPYSQDEPDIDDALIQLMADFKGRFSHNPSAVKYIASHNSSHRMVERLMHRFGRERGAELACEGYGEENGTLLVNMWERSQPRVPSTGEGNNVTEGASGPPTFAQDHGTEADPFRLTGSPMQTPAQLAPDETPLPPSQQIRPFGRSGSGISFVIPPPPPFVATVQPLSMQAVARPTPPRYDNQLSQKMHQMIGEAIRTRRSIPIRNLFDMLLQNLNLNHTFPGFQLLVKIMDALCREDQNDPAIKSRLELQVKQIYALGQDLLRFSSHSELDWLALENVMIIASCNFGHLEEAGLYRARIIQAGLVPSPDAYATMIASAKDTTDDAIVATQLWAECQAAGVKPHLYLYNTIISKLSKARKAEMALALFEQMKAQRVTPSSVTYGAVIVSLPRIESWC